MKSFDFRLITTNGGLAVLPLTEAAIFAVGADGFWAREVSFFQICALRARGFRFC